MYIGIISKIQKYAIKIVTARVPCWAFVKGRGRKSIKKKRDAPMKKLKNFIKNSV